MKFTLAVHYALMVCITSSSDLMMRVWAQSPPAYNYNESSTTGPAYWGDLDPSYAACKNGSTRQSPILVTPEILQVDVTLGNLDVVYAATTPANVSHNTHTPKLTVSQEAGVLTIGGERYILDDFHFHVPSEHEFPGYSFPMEIHLVHVAEADHTQIAVIALLYVDGENNNTFLAQFLDKLPSYTNTVESSIGDIMLPTIETGYYFRYLGSLTTPPCSETVTWTIVWPLQFPEISASQLEHLRSTMPEDNARPSQLAYDRHLSFNGQLLPPGL